MKRYYSKSRKSLLSEINVVPYIDVMLVLLVIFMITAPLLTQGVNVDLPHAKAKTLSAKQKVPIVVSVDAQGRYFLNIGKQPLKPIHAEALMSTVNQQLQIAKKAHYKRPVYVKGDRSVDYGKVIHAMVLLQRAGADNVGLITRST
jgi:biopolymer transport protein TolR